MKSKNKGDVWFIRRNARIWNQKTAPLRRNRQKRDSQSEELNHLLNSPNEGFYAHFFVAGIEFLYAFQQGLYHLLIDYA